MNDYGWVDDPEVGFYVDEWMAHHLPLWAAEEQREGLEAYLNGFSGVGSACPSCGGESDDGDACYDCYMRSMHDYY